MNKRFLLIMAVCVAVFTGLLLINKKDATAPTSSEASNHTYGEGKSGVVLVEYGDFECPACLRDYPVFKQLKEKYKDQVTFQFRHFPIVAAHQNAMAAHRAVEAASKQNKFWEMHDKVYEGQNFWKTDTNAAKVFESYAGELGLNIEKYKQDISSDEVNGTIKADMKAGNELGVSGTPTYVLNGKIIESPSSLEAFEKIIQDAIKEKSTS